MNDLLFIKQMFKNSTFLLFGSSVCIEKESSQDVDIAIYDPLKKDAISILKCISMGMEFKFNSYGVGGVKQKIN